MPLLRRMMTDAATILFCVGATKAGTSSLYRYLHDHPQCAVPAVKEAHYWDTFDAEQAGVQTTAFRLRLRELRRLREQAEADGKGWQVNNVTRRIDDMKALMQVIGGDRAEDQAYLSWLTGRQGGHVFADHTPNYATLPDAMLARMRDLSPQTRFIYLLRDPLDRLWSHIRMQARRQRQSHEVYEKKANNILHRMLNRGHETHIWARGDYPATIRKLRRVIPEDRLKIMFTETMMGQDGLSQLAEFLGMTPATPAETAPAHLGPAVEMLDKLRPRALKRLNEHYDWVARNVGPLPERWHENLARMQS